MKQKTQRFIISYGFVLSSCFLPYEFAKFDGYDLRVHTTDFCPRNQTEWNKRSSAINCTGSNGYMCLPNENITKLFEFCYIYPFIWIDKDVCLLLDKLYTKPIFYHCNHFRYGCPNSTYMSSKSFMYTGCLSIGDGCFIAEPSCKRTPRTTIRITRTTTTTTTTAKTATNIMLQETPESQTKDDISTTTHSEETTLHSQTKDTIDGISIWVLLTMLLSLLLGLTCFVLLIYISYLYYKKRIPICRVNDEESHESIPLFQEEQHDRMEKINNESVIVEQWLQENERFFSTNACREVEKHFASHNLVIVVGHSGSGKSAIIQHIALNYRNKGFNVKPIDSLNEVIKLKFLNEVSEKQMRTVFVLNDPIGKGSFDEIAFNEWRKHEEKIKTCLNEVKFLLSCRKYILSDERVNGLLKDGSCIVDIDDVQLKLRNYEKQNIWDIHTSSKKLSEKDLCELFHIEKYFPLLCRLHSGKDGEQTDSVRFFKEPVVVLKEEIRYLKTSCKEKYCALVLLVLFNTVLYVNDMLRDKISKEKFKHALQLCRMNMNTSPCSIAQTLESLKGFFVKKIGDNFYFYHDLVMEVTTFIFGSDYPTEIIKYADIGFLRRRVKLESSIEQKDQFSIHLSDIHINALGKRLFTDLFGERILDVVLNPCLMNEKIAKIFIEELKHHPQKIQMLLDKKELQIGKHALKQATKPFFLSKLDFLDMENEISALCALIVFCHPHISLYCLKVLKKLRTDITDISLFSGVCCNGSLELFKVFLDHQVKELLTKKWGNVYPIHIVSVFHNYEILRELIKFNPDVNLKTDEENGWTPLIFAAGHDAKNRENSEDSPSGTRRNRTVELLLSNGANINLCTKNGTSPLHVACYDGYDSTVQLLLSKQAQIDVSEEDGTTPFHIACQNGHDITVQYLLNSGVQINLCAKNGVGPLHLACENGHDSTVHLLLKNGAQVDLCDKNGASPLYIACKNGHESTVKLLLRNKAKINVCINDGTSPLSIVCCNGFENIINSLLDNGAEIDLCAKNGASPLYIACQNEYEGIVKLLLKNGAKINLCMNDGISPLSVACFNGHDNIIKCLIDNGADIDLCAENGVSPLYMACQYGHESAVYLLLKNGALINLCDEEGESPLYKACQNGHDIIAQLLLKNGAQVDLCKKNGEGPLFVACQNKRNSTIQILLRNDADINLCDENGTSPMYAACHEGHDSTVNILLRNGADINLCTGKGISPLQ